MIIKRLELRGAIGIQKGLFKEEITIDFAKFKAGLIAITGTNGSGKTTIIENLHPYRRIVSKPGSLKEHFYLKDSFRKLTFEYLGSEYKSIILIDGLTGSSEAYLHKDGKPVNDGKLTTYDEAITNLLGSEELFFSSVFSAQKAKGIADLKQSERRDLFYELLNLTGYEKYYLESKERMNSFLQKKTSIQSKIDTLQESITNQAALENQLTDEQHRIEQLNKDIEKAKKEIAEYEGKQNKLNDELTKQKIQLSENEIYQNQIKKLEEQLQETKKEEEQQYQALEVKASNQKSDMLAELYKKEEEAVNFKSQRILDLRLEQTEEENKGSELKEQYNKISDAIETEEKLLTRYNKIANNKNYIIQQNELLAKVKSELTELKEKLNNIISEENTINSELININAEQKAIQDAVWQSKTHYDKIGDRIKLLEESKEQLRLDFIKQSNEISRQTNIITEVPCDSLTGKKCQFLSDAYTLQNKLPEIKKQFEEKNEEIENLIAEGKIKLEEAKTEWYKHSGKNQAIKDKIEEINKILSGIKKQKETCQAEVSEKQNAVDKLLKEKWEQLLTELNTAETEIKVINERQKNYIDKKSQIEYSISQSEKKISDILKNIAQEKEDIEKTKQNYSVLRSDGLTALDIAIAKERDEIRKNYMYKQNRILNEIEETNKRIDLMASIEHEDLKREIYMNESNKSNAEHTLEILTEEFQTSKRNIGTTRELLNIANKVKEEINEKKKEIEELDRRILILAFFVKAFDKKGIPVMKLEHSGRQITEITNDLLSLFDNKFRIVLDTLKLKADGKEFKEAFDINVIDESGVCEVAYKSGGQIVWIETAIQLAIALLMRQQNRNIRTAYLDEKDGALSLENAYNYVKMLEEAHRQSKVNHTFVITHRTELLQYIQNQIRLVPGEEPITQVEE